MIAKLIYKSLMVGHDDSRCSGLLDYEGFSKKIKKKKKKKIKKKKKKKKKKKSCKRMSGKYKLVDFQYRLYKSKRKHSEEMS